MLPKYCMLGMIMVLTSSVLVQTIQYGNFLTQYYKNSKCHIALMEANKDIVPSNIGYVLTNGKHGLTNLWKVGTKFSTCTSIVIGKNDSLNGLENIFYSTSGLFNYKEMIFLEPFNVEPQNEDLTYILIGKTKFKIHCPGDKIIESLWTHSNWSTIHPLKLCPFALKGKHIVISTYLSVPPYVLAKPGGVLGGTNVDLFKYVAEALDFTYTFVMPKNEKPVNYKKKLNNGKYSIGLYTYVNLEYKTSGLQFVGPYYTYDLRFNCPVPKKLPPHLNLFKTWSPAVWVLVLSFWTLVCLVQTTLAKGYSTDPTKDFLRMYGSQIGIAINYKLKSISGASAILLLFWFLYVFLLLQTFQCNLRAIMSKPPYENEINTAQDLLDSGKELNINTATQAPKLFSSSPNIDHQRLFAKAVSDGSLYKSRGFNITKFMSFVERDSCSMGLVPLQKFLQSIRRRQGKGDLSEMRLAEETLFLGYFGWVAPIGKPWAREVVKVSRILTDTGIQEHVYRRLIHPKFISGSKGEDEAVGELAPFNLSHLFAAWIVIGTGLVLALNALSLELFYSKNKMNSSQVYV